MPLGKDGRESKWIGFLQPISPYHRRFLRPHFFVQLPQQFCHPRMIAGRRHDNQTVAGRRGGADRFHHGRSWQHLRQYRPEGRADVFANLISLWLCRFAQIQTLPNVLADLFAERLRGQYGQLTGNRVNGGSRTDKQCRDCRLNRDDLFRGDLKLQNLVALASRIAQLRNRLLDPLVLYRCPQNDNRPTRLIDTDHRFGGELDQYRGQRTKITGGGRKCFDRSRLARVRFG